MLRSMLMAIALIVVNSATAIAAEHNVLAGFAAVDITPAIGGEEPVYLAGYGFNRKALGVHDPLFARAVVLAHGTEKIAIVSVDLIGLQYSVVQAIRAKLPELAYVLVASTHNHEGPDVIGIWGRGPLHRGVNDEYLKLVHDRVVEAVRQAADNLAPVTAAYGTAEDESLLADSRLPTVKDGVLRVVRFNAGGTDRAAGLIVQWNCHPESLGAKNKQLTADFPAATIAALTRKYGCPVVYLSGALGGLMAPPKGRICDDAGNQLEDGNFEYAQKYGEEVARLADKALDGAQPLTLGPFGVFATPIAVPVHNALYRTANLLGVMERTAYVWSGNFQILGEVMTQATLKQVSAVQSEIAYLRLGELHVACLPGELYPELVYGKFADPSEPGVDFPDAPLEPHVAALMPGPKWLLVGLANDELGYIIPKRQWDTQAPFAYGKERGQYGEINSCSVEAAPILMEALKRRIAEAARAGQ